MDIKVWHSAIIQRLLICFIYLCFFLVLRSIYYFTPAVPFVKLLSSNKVFFDSFFFFFWFSQIWQNFKTKSLHVYQIWWQRRSSPLLRNHFNIWHPAPEQEECPRALICFPGRWFVSSSFRYYCADTEAHDKTLRPEKTLSVSLI